MLLTKKYMQQQKRHVVMTLSQNCQTGMIHRLVKLVNHYLAEKKQRISIARAILKNAPIIILDEATAFTDPQNEEQIQKSIVALTKGKTLLVIAHRLSTIQNANQIIVLENGKILDSGTHNDLLKNCTLYRTMWEAHIGAKHWAVSQKGGC